jgi:hypothetical protein
MIILLRVKGFQVQKYLMYEVGGKIFKTDVSAIIFASNLKRSDPQTSSPKPLNPKPLVSSSEYRVSRPRDLNTET